MPLVHWATAAALALLAACRSPSNTADSPRQADRSGAADRQQTTVAEEQPDTTPPADVSHGEAAIGGPAAEPAPVLAKLAPAEKTRLHKVRLEMTHTPVTIAPGIRYTAWTFGATVPGPALHVRQGDTVEFTLVNRANIPHSMDFHAAEIAPSKYYVNVMPGDSLHYRFVPRTPGAFMYHCGTAPAAMHIANGMYGALVVDPATPRPKAREFVFVQSEFYLTPKPAADGTRSLEWQKFPTLAPDHVVFNGRADQYAAHPLEGSAERAAAAPRGECGPQQDQLLPCGWRHVRTGFSGRLAPEPGDYPFVTHAFADATKGAVGILRALAPGEASGSQASAMSH